MNANTKKWINRFGLAGVILGAVLLVVGGGDVNTAFETAGKWATAIGGFAVLIRELLG